MTGIKGNIDLTAQFVSHFSEVQQLLTDASPELLNRPRKQARDLFLETGIPTRKNEDYKFTSLLPAFSKEYAMVTRREEPGFRLKDVFSCDVPRLDSLLVLILNGWFYSAMNKHEKADDAIFIDSLERSAGNGNELIRQYYSKLSGTSSDPLAALNTAFARDGYFIHISKNARPEFPVQIINLLRAGQDSYTTQRNLLVVEPGAEVKIIVCDHTLNLHSYLDNQLTEVFIGENASLDFYVIQNRHNDASCVNSTFFHLEKDARLTTHAITLHGGLVRNNVKVILDGVNAEANLYGMSFMDRKQHLDNFIQVIHEKPGCRSNQHYKNVLDDESTGAFSGRIHVKRNAQKTNAYQRNNNLLLTDKAQMNTKPQLVIEADDVKCSHGATVGQMDENALFYLRSRGIDRDQARLMLMNAFSYEVVRQVKVEPLRDRISELVDKRLRGDVGRCHECAYHCDC